MNIEEIGFYKVADFILREPPARDECFKVVSRDADAHEYGDFSEVARREMILEQNIRDMNDQVPRMNESIAMVKANVTLLEKEEAKYKTEVYELTSKVKAAIQANRDDLAGLFYFSRCHVCSPFESSSVTRHPSSVIRHPGFDDG